jgi:hypothetical protein
MKTTMNRFDVVGAINILASTDNRAEIVELTKQPENAELMKQLIKNNMGAADVFGIIATLARVTEDRSEIARLTSRLIREGQKRKDVCDLIVSLGHDTKEGRAKILGLINQFKLACGGSYLPLHIILASQLISGSFTYRKDMISVINSLALVTGDPVKIVELTKQ